MDPFLQNDRKLLLDFVTDITRSRTDIILTTKDQVLFSDVAGLAEAICNMAAQQTGRSYRVGTDMGGGKNWHTALPIERIDPADRLVPELYIEQFNISAFLRDPKRNKITILVMHNGGSQIEQAFPEFIEQELRKKIFDPKAV